jgi:hypothetical protein
MVWEDYPLQKDYTWEPIKNVYDQEEQSQELVETYEKWLKADNERLDIEEREKKIAKRLTTENLQNAAAEKCKKDITLRKKTKGKQSIDKGTFDQHVADDETETRDDGDNSDGVIGAEGVDTEANRKSRHRSFRTVVRTEFINTTSGSYLWSVPKSRWSSPTARTGTAWPLHRPEPAPLGLKTDRYNALV